jgi:hypothetical protein
MKKNHLKLAPNWVLLDMIEFKSSDSAPALYDFNGNLTASSAMMRDHPYRGVVVASCEYYDVGSSRYRCPLHEGDVALLPGFPIISKGGVPQNTMIVEGRKYVLVRYAEIRGYYTPSEQERSQFTFKLIEAGESQKRYAGELT